MQDHRAGSTLELVVNEQQLQNMSQIDLSGQGANNPNQTNQNGTRPEGGSISLEALGNWLDRCRDSLGSKLEEAKAKSESRTQYVIEVIRAFSGLIVWLLCFVSTIILPLILLLVGLLNLDDCEASPSLPYYIFTIGFIMTASNLFNLALALDLPILANHRLLATDIKSIIASILNIIFNSAVAFVYMLTAYKVLTFSSQQTSAGQTGDGGATSAPVLTCNASLYTTSFWFITLTLGLFVIISLLGSLLFAYNRYRLNIMRGSAPRSHPHVSNLSGNPTNISAQVTTTNRL